MLIAQITDVHLGFEPGNPGEFNRTRLDQVLRLLCEGPNRPDLLLATGDLADKGDPESYRQLLDALSACPFPVWPCVGNHDDRGNFLRHFPDLPIADGFVQYEVDLGPLRLIVLDTLEEGRHGGAFCDTRARWLQDRLAEQREKPTIVVMHHPPVEVGIDWMDIGPQEPWVGRVASALAGRRQVKAVLCGHLHRPIVAPWNDTTVIMCPSTAPQLALDLRSIDSELPDDRAMIVADPPAFALHWWNGRELVTHFDTADEHKMLAKFDRRMQSLVRGLQAERSE
ncbi:phosphodiesterase [Rhizorhapis suberifaciens]|uniref:3',5'-cyclic AMP phosphodiesterase CpdA n=1 Tax=Rhizorhapis suberifaciens TaxID=13656 RepID=A0A840HSL1_9SPHN|nr:phosphodiesterase [Rhizorhapis suberifaciens]MBB4640701.1 3',5'-cyclic AMP phosphodiesterase CpdA [Rhizorhapis suberifaciens]